jgi:acetyl/propionyl-CoA carboxylase alpha subunit
VLNQKFETTRFADAATAWQRSFSLADMKILVVCRGPVREEAFQVFVRAGVGEWGMLLSEKDSVTYPRCLAPELRCLAFPKNVHRVADYMGVGQEEKLERIAEIIEIAKDHGYTHLFAGYGFMAEDAEFVASIEAAGLGFVGPSSSVIRQAGAKDEAKKLARGLGNAVIPGVDDLSSRVLAARAPDSAALEAIANDHSLAFSWDADKSVVENSEALLQTGYAQTRELVTIEELQVRAGVECEAIWADYPDRRIRFKHIGGGGGKGQRVVSAPEAVANAVMDILAESKVIEPGSNRNFLIELNLESTRHNEIQLIGNGSWCISLGGRDCSVQMHEQKLLEISLTQELLDAELETAAPKAAEILRGDKGTLERMETEGARFGEATGLNSVSTFECIIDGFDHFFMEMNTRIQVEHIVTELAYRLKFTNPDDSTESFFIEDLIEAMCVLAVHGQRLPKPERMVRNVSALEVRINATNQALQPHAGGMIKAWTAPLEGEIRYDQGIGARNPDTGSFVYYNLAGAYDSNVALVLTVGKNRRENFEAMAESLRRMELRGDDLQTNLPAHYGLVQWFLGKGVMSEPTTGFMGPFLTAVGALQLVVNDVDLDVAIGTLVRNQEDPAGRRVLAAKETLLRRPIERLLGNAHLLAGFLGRFDGDLWVREGDNLTFGANAVTFLHALYHYLDLEDAPGKTPAERIWSHDLDILNAADGFYAEVEAQTHVASHAELEEFFAGDNAAKLGGTDAALWAECVAAHRGFQEGLQLLLLIPRIGLRSGFLDIRVGEDLAPVFPAKFEDEELAKSCLRALAPPPRASSDEIVTPMGGTFYSREAPHLPLLTEVGAHFEAGEPLFIIEVMKMFNKISVPFSGTITANLAEELDAKVVAKGQAIFKIEPDEKVEEESDEVVAARCRDVTGALMA